MMKKNISWFLLSFLFLLSCQKEMEAPVETGYLRVFATQNHDLSVLTRSTDDLPISIAICDANSGDTVEFFNSYNEDLGTNKVDLPVGKYYIKASTQDVEDAIFDKPFYYGADTVDIKLGYIVEAEVECVLANTKVTVVYSDRLKTFFTGYKARVSNSSGSLIFDEDEERAGYYVPEKLDVVLDLINNDGTAYRVVKELPNVKAREHYRLAFSVEEAPENPEAGADFEITVDESTNDINCNLTVPIFTDDYGRNMPRIVSTSNYVNIKHTNPAPTASLESAISASRGLSVVALKLVSPYFNTTHSLPTYINLMEANVSVITKLNTIGITGINSLVDDIRIDFTTLLGSLPIDADGKSMTHTIGLLVRDSLGQQVEDTIIVNVRPNIAIELKSSAWSRFAYVNAVLGTKEDVKIKHRVEGTTSWLEQSIPSSEIDQAADGSYILEKKIIGLENSTKYEYLVMAGLDEASGEFTTTGETPLENGGFEDWNSIDAQSFWGSGNNTFITLTTSVTGREGSEGTKAVELASKSAVGKFAAGNIFTGTFNLDGMNGELNIGRGYTSRPTALKGYYKYKPANVNSSSSHIASGVKDTCSIYIALTTSAKYVHSADASTFFKKDDPIIIAYAELPKAGASETAGDGYHEFNLPLEYRDLYKVPTHIIIVCSSSKYGDYFSGGVGSKLWLDDFSLDFSE